MIEEQTPPFLDKLCPPDDRALEEALGPLHQHYLSLRSLCRDFLQEWRYPGKKFGWVWKVERKKKALFWLTPLYHAYRIGFIIRPSEMEPLLSTSRPGAVRTALEHAVVYPEGLGLSLTVTESQEFEDICEFVREIISIRPHA